MRLGLRVDGVVGEERGLAPYAAGGAEEGEVSAVFDLGEGDRGVEVAAELIGDLFLWSGGGRGIISKNDCRVEHPAYFA